MINFYIKDIKITCCDLDSSSENAISFIRSNGKNYICVTDAGNLVNAHRNSPELKDAINNSYISLPDGIPVSKLAKLKGIKDIDRVAGQDFMKEVFKKTSDTDIKHFFLGDTEDVLKSLKEKLKAEYKINISGSYSPEFGVWTEETDREIIRRINMTNPDFIWVSLGGGKQEIWMKNNFMKLDKGLMTGVGAAFRFFTGDIKRAPVFIQKSGFEWLHRLIQQPDKMFKRYATTLPFFLLYSVQELFKINSNKT
ncbi:MAG TPA: WecB/TagA/CpsF family glycosyltransferase [Ignavibacteria bacterium]|nr:WecB/TagA/CpsF family glycosyltransferase [Ignavibacteria bacterium]